ncbi:MAG TPA: flagellar FliJ family protein [Nitrospiria bacterium]|nr:flagellar FliJ family protein [Nitrospiria bacterium]
MEEFRSKLEPVHRQRPRRVEEIQKEYAEMMDRLREEEERGERMHELLEHTLRDIAQRIGGEIPSGDLDAYYRFVAHQSAELTHLRDTLDQLRADCEAKRAVLVGATHEEPAIAEPERSHQRAERLALDAREQYAVDDLASRRSAA